MFSPLLKYCDLWIIMNSLWKSFPMDNVRTILSVAFSYHPLHNSIHYAAPGIGGEHKRTILNVTLDNGFSITDKTQITSAHKCVEATFFFGQVLFSCHLVGRRQRKGPRSYATHRRRGSSSVQARNHHRSHGSGGGRRSNAHSPGINYEQEGRFGDVRRNSFFGCHVKFCKS